MNGHLFVDGIRRNWTTIAIQAGLAATIWIAAGAELFSTGVAIAASMALAQFSGPGLAGRVVAPREVLILPLSKAEIWRTRFWFSIAMVAGAVASGKLLGLAASNASSQPAPGLETIAVSTVLDVVYASAFTWLFFILPAKSIQLAIWVAVFLLSPFVPFVLADRLPTAWHELTATSIILISAGGMAGVLAYFSTPMLVTAPSPVAGRPALKTKGRGWLPEFPQVVGLNRLLMKVWSTALVIQIGTLLVMPMGLWLFNGFAGPWIDWTTSMREFGLLPFDPQANRMNVVWVWIFASIGNETIMGTIRHLRSLPLTARALTAVLISSSLITWINAWIVLGVCHLMVLGELPVTWRMPLFLGYFGCDCLTRSLQLRWNTRFGFVLVLLLVVFPIGLAARALHFSLDSVLLSLGPVAVLVAAWLSHSALTTNRAAYARRPQRGPFGVEQPS